MLKRALVALGFVGLLMAASIEVTGSTLSPAQTQAVINLWVNGNDPGDGGKVGNDNNACTSNDAGACATLAGAIAKLSGYSQICNNVTINMAGNIDGGYLVYSGTSILTGFDYCIRDGGGTPSITFAGPPLAQWAPYYVDAGTNSGTVSSTTSSGLNGAFTVNANGQVWVDGGLKGLFFVDTATGSARPIIDNTAATLRLTSSGTINASDPYIIAVPAVQIASPSSTSSLNIINNRVTVSLQDIGFSGLQGWPAISGNGQVNLTRVWFFNNQAAAPTFNIGSHSTGVSLGQVAFLSARANVLATSGVIPSLSVSNTYVLGPNQSSWTMKYSHSGSGSCLGFVVENTGTSGSGLQLDVAGSNTLTCTGSPRFICPTGTTGQSGLYAGGNTGNLPALGSFSMNPTNFFSEGCLNAYIGTGVGAIFRTATNTGTITVVGATNGFSTARGARTYLTAGNTFTFTGVTNELVIDGTAKSYAGNLTGNGCIPNATYLSAVCE